MKPDQGERVRPAESARSQQQETHAKSEPREPSRSKSNGNHYKFIHPDGSCNDLILWRTQSGKIGVGDSCVTLNEVSSALGRLKFDAEPATARTRMRELVTQGFFRDVGNRDGVPQDSKWELTKLGKTAERSSKKRVVNPAPHREE